MHRHLLPFSLVVTLVAVAGLLSLNSCSDSAPGDKLNGPVDGDKAFQHVKAMVEFGPRPAGTPAIVKTRNYIKAELEKLGLKANPQKFLANPKKPIQFVNIWTQIDGSDPVNGPILAIAAHYDTKLCQGHPDPKHNFEFVGAIDGAGGSGVILELARHLVKRPVTKDTWNVWLIWFDGEECLEFDWKDELALFGSKYFADKMAKDKKLFPKGLRSRMKAFVLLDLIGDKNIKIDDDQNSNRDLKKIFQAVGKAMGEEKRMFQHKSKYDDDHIPFQQKFVRVIDLIDFHHRIPNPDGSAPHPDYQAWWHTPEDTPDKMSAEALAFAGNLVWHAIPRIQKLK